MVGYAFVDGEDRWRLRRRGRPAVLRPRTRGVIEVRRGLLKTCRSKGLSKGAPETGRRCECKSVLKESTGVSVALKEDCCDLRLPV